MRALLAWTAVALFGLVAFAGCSGKAPPAPADPLVDGANQLDLAATPTTGVIRGVVVDQAIRPVASATVSLTADRPVETKSNEAGAFGFDDLPPGTYFLKVHKIGYADTQQSVDVVAGVTDPAAVKVLLQANLGALPSFDVFHFAGFLECNVVVVIFFFPCQAPVVGSIGNDHFSETFNVTGNITWIHTSLVWQPTQPVGTELYMNVGTPDTEIVGYAGGPSPQVVDVDGNDTAQFENGAVVIEVSGNGEQGLAGAEIEQGFDAYVVVFHNFLPPSGYAYYRDGEPVPPQ